jgi:acyl-CoA synthetase (NDP forming)
MSNAGFESVAFADNIGPFKLAEIGEATRERIASLLREARLDRIVTVGNPIDVNPMLPDAAFAEVAAELIGDDGVDAAIIGVVPLTGALRTLQDEISADESIVNRLAVIWRSTEKPWVCVVDGGARYDAMRRALAEAGIPTFISSDRAIRALGRWCG